VLIPLLAEAGQRSDVQATARGAERVVVAVVEDAQPRYERNEFGDQLIVTSVQLRVREVLKGAAVRGDERLSVDVEGGTIDGVTMSASDLPAMSRGERAIFFLVRKPTGRYVPHRRGQGILKLDSSDRLADGDITLGDVRRIVREP
jgi:hypothetical protein